jgi:hypothetical protein
MPLFIPETKSNVTVEQATQIFEKNKCYTQIFNQTISLSDCAKALLTPNKNVGYNLNDSNDLSNLSNSNTTNTTNTTNNNITSFYSGIRTL